MFLGKLLNFELNVEQRAARFQCIFLHLLYVGRFTFRSRMSSGPDLADVSP